MRPSRGRVGTPARRLGAYGVVLALSLGAGALVGEAVGPIDTSGDPDHGGSDPVPTEPVHTDPVPTEPVHEQG